MLKKLFMFMAVMVLTGAMAYAAPADLPETGQTKCYDSNNPANEIVCANTGQDGELQKGVAWPSPRFTDNADGTVTDNLTGLIWLKDANCFSLQSWANALNAANTLNSAECGLTDGSAEGDWRLPNVNELESLINAEQADTAAWLNAQGFSNVRVHFYWSSSTYASFTTDAWGVHMWSGIVYGVIKTNTYYIWPVRAGQ